MDSLPPFHVYHWRVYEQDLEQTSQLRPPQPLHHTFPIRHCSNPHSTPCCFAVPRSRRGTNWDKRLEHEGRLYVNAACFQHRRPYSNTARGRPEATRGGSRGEGSWASLRSGRVWGGTHLRCGLLVCKIDTASGARGVPRGRLGCGGAAGPGGAVVVREARMFCAES